MWNKHINLLNVLCSGLLAKSKKCLFPVSCSLVKHFYRFTKQPEWASAGGGVSTKESCSALLVCSPPVRIHSHREKTSLHFIWTQINQMCLQINLVYSCSELRFSHPRLTCFTVRLLTVSLRMWTLKRSSHPRVHPPHLGCLPRLRYGNTTETNHTQGII